MEFINKKEELFNRFKNLKGIANEDPNVMGFINDYNENNISFDECIEMIIVNYDLRIKGLQDMFVKG